MVLSSALVSAIASLVAHPIHTTMTELTIDPLAHAVRATVRVFADDLRATNGGAGVESYVAAGLAIADGAGKRVDLRPCGVRRTNDVLFVCVEGRFAGAARELRVSNVVLCDVFPDQVNVVQATVDGSRRSLLFTRGDRPKPVT